MDSLRLQPATATRPTRMLDQGGSMKLVKEIPDSDSQEEWLARERAHLSQVLYRYTPLVIDHAQGSYLYTVDGRRILDFASGIAVTSLGHGHPEVIKAAHQQLDKLVHISVVAHHQPAIQLAERIAALAPGKLDKVFFANSGAEAVEGAIKLARYVTGRPALIAFQGAFHGRTYGALSLTASKGYYRERYEPLLPAVYHTPYPYAYRNPTGPGEAATLDYVFNAIEEMLDTRVPPRNVAAFIVEPVLGEGGYVVPPAAFLPRLRTLCDQHGILLIADEVQSGYGRTGKMFASEHTRVVPDIMTLAKSIASGLPLSAIVASSKLMDQWEPAAHGSTFGGNPVACAAGVATLDVFEREGTLKNTVEKGAELIRRLRDLQQRMPAIGDVRGLGLMIGVELVKKDGTPDKELQKRIRKVCLDTGMVLLSCGPHDNVLRLVPPLNISQTELDEGWEILNGAFQEVAA
jgi:4-aminobutyrate aminotransferase